LTLEGATERHHVYLLPVGADNDDLTAHERVMPLPDRYFFRPLGTSALYGTSTACLCLSCPGVRLFRTHRLRFSCLWFPRQLERYRIIVSFFEVLRDSAEIEQEEILLFVFCRPDLEGVESSATSLDLNVLRRRKNRAHKRNIENIQAVVACGEHVDGDGDAL